MICIKSGKEQHKREKANAHLANLKEKFGYGGEVYKCPYCGFFHVGKNKKTKGRVKSEKKLEFMH